MLKHFLYGFVCVVGFAQSASALQIPNPPSGMCALNPAVPADKAAIDFISAANKDSNEVLSLFADCTQLKAMHDGKAQGIDRYGMVLRQTGLGGVNMSRQDYVSAMAKTFEMMPQLREIAATQAKAAAQLGAKEVPGMQIASGGVEGDVSLLRHSADTAIFTSKQNRSVDGKPLTVAGVSAVSKAGDTPFAVNIYSPASANAFVQNAGIAEGHVKAIISQNE